MSINSRPPRDDQQDRTAFVERATEQDTTKLQCWIPSDLHFWLKEQALHRRTNMTSLVVEALQNYQSESQPPQP